MAEQPPAESRYRAFLSYSHKDAAAAGRLHRRLEAYRLPRRLIGRTTARGPVPERLWPIFRDREELPAATDLSETVRDALGQSETLIVLCSHHAATSLWVAEEIETFRSLHPGRPILAAILDGDPPDCFPAALRAFGTDGRSHEPLATDLRPSGDGPGLGLLKLVAGITGVGLDDLVQRDAARKVRRVTAVTGAALIAMLVMAALTWVALAARAEAERQGAEAERQRAESERLVEFMLTDLRTNLKGVGRIEIMQAVNARALQYYGRQWELARLPADSLLRRARVLHAIGEDEVIRGDIRAALAAIREARRTTTEQLARTPNDLRRLRDHARSDYLLGRVFEVRQNWPMAQRQYARFAAATDRLLAAEPNNPDYMREVAWSAIDLGNVQLGTRNFAAAQRLYEKAVYWFGRAAQARPRDEAIPLAQANAYSWLAQSYYGRELWRQALAARWRQYGIVERLLRARPDNVEYRFRFAVARRGLAQSLRKVGDLRNARSHAFSAYDQSRRLTALDPQNAEWLLFHAFLHCDLYFGGLGFPPGVNGARLHGDLNAVAQTLRAQNNPRATEFSHCLTAMDEQERQR